MMTSERYRQLASIYGADPARWPETDRNALTANDRQVLTQETAYRHASELDHWLDSHQVDPPDDALFRQILAEFPKQRESFWRHAGFWWSGGGLLGIGVAGALAGTLAFSVITPMVFSAGVIELPTEFPYADTAFGSSAGDWSLE